MGSSVSTEKKDSAKKWAKRIFIPFYFHFEMGSYALEKMSPETYQKFSTNLEAFKDSMTKTIKDTTDEATKAALGVAQENLSQFNTWFQANKKEILRYGLKAIVVSASATVSTATTVTTGIPLTVALTPVTLKFVDTLIDNNGNVESTVTKITQEELTKARENIQVAVENKVYGSKVGGAYTYATLLCLVMLVVFVYAIYLYYPELFDPIVNWYNKMFGLTTTEKV